MTKGEDTRSTVLDEALDLSSELGLEGLTIGVLAKKVGMSKSGLYAHFGSKEELQCDVLDRAAAKFVASVLSPALRKPRGLPRLRALFDHWLRWEGALSGGCPFIAAATEFDDRPGVVRDRLVKHLTGILDSAARVADTCVDEADFADTVDSAQIAYELWGILLAQNHYGRLLRRRDARQRARRSFDHLVRRAASA